MNKILKYIVGLVTLVMVVAAVFVAIFISNLPSAGEIKGKIAGAPSPAETQQRIAPPSTPEETPTTTSVADEKNTPQASVENKEAESGNKAVEELVFNAERPLANICDHLAEAPGSPMFAENDKNDFFKGIVDAAKQNPDDPFANAVFAPVRFALRLPRAKSFFEEIRAAEANGEQNMMQKVGFYSKGLAAYQEIQASNKIINNVSNYAYYLFLMGQVVRKNPQISQNPEAQQYCHEIQENLTSGKAFDNDKASAEMMKFLEFANISPEDVKFDPQFKSEVKVEFTNSNFSIGFGWIGKYMGDQQTKTN